MQIAISIPRDDFLHPLTAANPSGWVFMYHRFYETFSLWCSRASVIQRELTREGILNAISHAIYVCGMVMHEVEVNEARDSGFLEIKFNPFARLFSRPEVEASL
jgi:hypothetical protein